MPWTTSESDSSSSSSDEDGDLEQTLRRRPEHDDSDDDDAVVQQQPANPSSSSSHVTPPTLDGGSVLSLGGSGELSHVFAPMLFAGRRFVVSSLASSSAVIEQVFMGSGQEEEAEGFPATRLCQVLGPPRDQQRLLLASVAEDTGVFALAYPESVVLYSPLSSINDDEEEEDFVLSTPQWRQTGELRPKEPSQLLCMSLSRSLLALGFSRSLQVWNVTAGEMIYASLDYGARWAGFSPDGRLLGTLSAAPADSGDAPVRVWFRNKNANEALSHVALRARAPAAAESTSTVESLEWRRSSSSSNNNNSLLVFTKTPSLGLVEIFEQGNADDAVSFYPACTIDLALDSADLRAVRLVGWVRQPLSTGRTTTTTRLLWQSSSASSSSDWAEMDAKLQQSASSSSSTSATDYVVCLFSGGLKRYCVEGLGETSPRVGIRCGLVAQLDFAREGGGGGGAGDALQCKTFFAPASPSRQDLCCFVQWAPGNRPRRCLIADFNATATSHTGPFGGGAAASHGGVVFARVCNNELVVTQDDDTWAVSVWGRRGEGVDGMQEVWRSSSDGDKLVVAAAWREDAVLLVSANAAATLVLLASGKRVNLPVPSMQQVEHASLVMTTPKQVSVAYLLPRGVAVVRYALGEEDGEAVMEATTTWCDAIPGRPTTTCLATGGGGGGATTCWVATEQGKIYRNCSEYFTLPPPSATVTKLVHAGIWMCALAGGKAFVGSLGGGGGSQAMVALVGDGTVLDLSLHEFAANCYALVVLRETAADRTEVAVYSPSAQQPAVWREVIATSIPASLRCDRVAWWGSRILASFSNNDADGGGGGAFWGLTGEMAPSGAHVSTLCALPELPEFHPRILMELFRLGDLARVEQVLRHVLQCVRGEESSAARRRTQASSSSSGGGGMIHISPTPPPPSHPTTPEPLSQQQPAPSLSSAFSMWGDSARFNNNATQDDGDDDANWLDDLEQLLPTKRVAGLSPNELLLVLNICNLLRKFTQTQNFKALDRAGMHFALAVENYKLNKLHNRIKSSEVLWALHSSTQANLIQLFASSPNASSWEEDLAPIGAGYWMENAQDCVALVERMAKAAHVRNAKDPFGSLLYYCALGKPKVSSALFKLQGKTKLAVLLAMDFPKSDDARVIAVKNAYACMEKKMFPPAAAFFLLGGKFNEALRVLARNLGDCQLALVIGRVVAATTGGGGGGGAGTALESMDLILREFTWEMARANHDPFLGAICQTLRKRSLADVAACFLHPSPSSGVAAATAAAAQGGGGWLVEFAVKHEAIQVGRRDPLMTVLFLRHVKSDAALDEDVNDDCAMHYLKERMPTIARVFGAASLHDNDDNTRSSTEGHLQDQPHRGVVDALRYGKPYFTAQTTAEEILLALLRRDYGALVKLLYDREPATTTTTSGSGGATAAPASWMEAFCSRVLVLLVLELLLEEIADDGAGCQAGFAGAVEGAIAALLGEVRTGAFALGLPTLQSALDEEVVRALSTFQFVGTSQQQLWELLNGPKEVERFILAVAVQQRRRRQPGGYVMTAAGKPAGAATTYTLYSKPGLGLSSLGLFQGDTGLVLASAKQGLRELNIHSSLAYRARSADGLSLQDAERDSYVGVRSRFQLQERTSALGRGTNTTSSSSETWEELLLARAMRFPSRGRSSTTTSPTTNTATVVEPRGDRDRSVCSKLAVHPGGGLFVACGRDGAAQVWSAGEESPTCTLTGFSAHPVTVTRFNGAGSFLLAVDTTGMCALYSSTSLQDEAFFHTTPFKPSSVTDATFLTNTVFATTNTEGKISVFDTLLPPKSCMVASWHHPPPPRTGSSSSSDGKRLAATPLGAAAAATSSSASTGGAAAAHSALTRLVYCADMDCLVTGSDKGMLFAVDMRKCIAIDQVLVTHRAISSLALSPSSQRLACGTADGAVLVWDLSATTSSTSSGESSLLGKPCRILAGLHLGAPAVTKPTFFKAASQMTLIANSTPTLAATLSQQPNVVTDVEFARDGSSLFTCGSDGTAKLTVEM